MNPKHRASGATHRSNHTVFLIRPCVLTFIAITLLLQGIALSQSTPNEPVTVTFWNIWGGTRAPLLDKILGKFEETHPGIKVQNVTLPSSVAQQRMIAAVASGTPPDIYMTTAYELRKWAKLGGFIRPLDDFIAQDGLDLSKYLIPAAIQGSTVNGHVLQLPFKLSTPMMIWFNKDLFTEAGLDPDHPPQTWQELKKAAKALTKMDGRVIKQLGLDTCINCSGDTPENAFVEWLSTDNGQVVSDDGSKVTFNKNGAALQTLNFMKSVMDDTVGGYSNMVSQMGTDWKQQRPAFYAGKIAMLMDGPWFLNILRTEAPQMVSKVGVFLEPYNGENPEAKHRGVVYGVPGYFIPAGAKHPKAAWEVLKFIALSQDGACQFFLDQGRVDSPLLHCEDPNAKKDNPFYQTFKELINTTTAIPAPPSYNEIHLRLKAMQAAVLRGVEKPADAIKSAASDIQKILDRGN